MRNVHRDGQDTPSNLINSDGFPNRFMLKTIEWLRGFEESSESQRTIDASRKQLKRP